jgi:DNA uptake protein ComE-like DNA-binding protein
VPGLNRKLAAAIVRTRPLRSLDDLKRVRGIGDKLLRALRTHLTV